MTECWEKTLWKCCRICGCKTLARIAVAFADNHLKFKNHVRYVPSSSEVETKKFGICINLDRDEIPVADVMLGNQLVQQQLAFGVCISISLTSALKRAITGIAFIAGVRYAWYFLFSCSVNAVFTFTFFFFWKIVSQ